MRFFVATKNSGKAKEFARIFAEFGIDMITESDFDKSMPEPEETGATFAENALIKARCGAKFSGVATVADDSGLCVDALGGRPGIYSARYAGEHGNSAANNKKLLKELEGIPLKERAAHFACAIACVFEDGQEFTVCGECAGFIDFCETGDNGFGYDPLFISEAGKFSEISAEQKDLISHRGKALKLFKEKLKEYI